MTTSSRVMPRNDQAADRGEPAACNATTACRRLYRGLKEPYDPKRPATVGASGVDFTDCPLTALMYAHGRRGVVLVVDVEPDAARVSEELGLNQEAKRFMFWGSSFKDLVLAQIPAKELRAQVRRRGIVTASPRKILIDRVRRDEDHLSRETAGPRSVRLFDRRPRPQGRFDGERVSVLDVALDEALALSLATARQTWRGIAR